MPFSLSSLFSDKKSREQVKNISPFRLAQYIGEPPSGSLDPYHFPIPNNADGINITLDNGPDDPLRVSNDAPPYHGIEDGCESEGILDITNDAPYWFWLSTIMTDDKYKERLQKGIAFFAAEARAYVPESRKPIICGKEQVEILQRTLKKQYMWYMAARKTASKYGIVSLRDCDGYTNVSYTDENGVDWIINKGYIPKKFRR